MTDLNYKPLIKGRIDDFFEEHPDYTFGQLIYSLATSSKGKEIKDKIDFLNLTDADFYTGIDLALKKEKNEDHG